MTILFSLLICLKRRRVSAQANERTLIPTCSGSQLQQVSQGRLADPSKRPLFCVCVWGGGGGGGLSVDGVTLRTSNGHLLIHLLHYPQHQLLPPDLGHFPVQVSDTTYARLAAPASAATSPAAPPQAPVALDPASAKPQPLSMHLQTSAIRSQPCRALFQ